MDVHHWHCMDRSVKESQRVVWFRKSENMQLISRVPLGARHAAFAEDLLHEDGHSS